MTNNGSIVDDQGKLMNNFAVESTLHVDEQGDVWRQAARRLRTSFITYAELLNGRLKMIIFVSMRRLEAFTGHSIFGVLANL